MIRPLCGLPESRRDGCAAFRSPVGTAEGSRHAGPPGIYPWVEGGPLGNRTGFSAVPLASSGVRNFCYTLTTLCVATPYGASEAGVAGSGPLSPGTLSNRALAVGGGEGWAGRERMRGTLGAKLGGLAGPPKKLHRRAEKIPRPGKGSVAVQRKS